MIISTDSTANRQKNLCVLQNIKDKSCVIITHTECYDEALFLSKELKTL